MQLCWRGFCRAQVELVKMSWFFCFQKHLWIDWLFCVTTRSYCGNICFLTWVFEAEQEACVCVCVCVLMPVLLSSNSWIFRINSGSNNLWKPLKSRLFGNESLHISALFPESKYFFSKCRQPHSLYLGIFCSLFQMHINQRKGNFVAFSRLHFNILIYRLFITA